MTEMDLDSVLAIEQVCFPRPWNRNHFMSELHSTHSLPVVAENAGIIGGYLCLSVVLDEAEVLDLAVAPEMQRCGIGAALMEWAFDESLKQGANILRLEVRASSLPAIGMYERFGFRKCGIRKSYYENSTDAILMEKVL